MNSERNWAQRKKQQQALARAQPPGSGANYPCVLVLFLSRDVENMATVKTAGIRVLVVDHNPLLREGLSVLIRAQLDMELIGPAADASQALALFERHRPDITLMDLDLPNGAGIIAIEQICKINSTACVLGLLIHEWDHPCLQALRAGARRCVAKDKLDTELLTLIRESAAQTQ